VVSVDAVEVVVHPGVDAVDCFTECVEAAEVGECAQNFQVLLHYLVPVLVEQVTGLAWESVLDVDAFGSFDVPEYNQRIVVPLFGEENVVG
jgi:hypothetical protein